MASGLGGNAVNLNVPMYEKSKAGKAKLALETITRTSAEAEDLRRECLSLAPHVKESSSSKSRFRIELKSRFKECFDIGMASFNEEAQCCIIDGSVWLGSQMQHTPGELKKQAKPYTCRDMVDQFVRRVKEKFKNASFKSVVLVFDVPEYVSPAKGCTHAVRRKSKLKSDVDLNAHFVDEQYEGGTADFFGDAYYSQNWTSATNAEREQRIADVNADPTHQGIDGIATVKKLSVPTLEEMLSQLDAVLPGPLQDILSHKTGGRSYFLGWLCKHLLAAVKLKGEREFIILGHCINEGEIGALNATLSKKNAVAMEDDILPSEYREGCAPICKIGNGVIILEELRNTLGEADQSIFFMLEELWRDANGAFKCFEIESADTDFIYNGLAFLAEVSISPVSGEARFPPSIYNLYEPRTKQYCSLNRLLVAVEGYILTLIGGKSRPIHTFGPMKSHGTMEFFGTGLDPLNREEVARRWSDVDHQATKAYSLDKDAYISPVWHLLGMAALFNTDYSRVWPGFGPIKWFNALEAFPSHTLPLMERGPQGVVEFRMEAVVELVTCAYSLINTACFSGHGEIANSSPSERCNIICRQRKARKPMRGVDMKNGARKLMVSHMKAIPPDTIEMVARILNSQYYIYILCQTGLRNISLPSLESSGYCRDINGRVHYLYNSEDGH